MNAAFLLVATAFVTGSDPVQAVPAPAAPAAIVSSGCSSCNSGCNTCDTCERTKLFGGFRGLFSRSSDCGCDSCGSKKLFSSSCGCGGGFSLGLRERFAGFGHKSCDTCNTCAQEKSCGCGIMESPLSRLGGLFRKKSCGCAAEACNSCSSCGSTGAVIQGAPITPVPASGTNPAPVTPKAMPAAPGVPVQPKPAGGQLTPTSNLIIE